MKIDDIDRVGNRIKDIRKKKSLTITELAKYTDLSVGYLSNIERNQTSPTLRNLSTICSALNISLRDIITAVSYTHLDVYKRQKGYRHLFVVEEEQGAWGKEYVCREILLPNVSNEGQTTLVYADLGGLPVVVSSTEPLSDGTVVRLS